ncbi:1748_t:CDS:2 [Entrophospora sp. SA101]|nr:10620_t:CDS:2 [Entrophospora sp. SA101]CAJ0857413.1 1748_t:CDS:2 [Entrophospora sp. SA101]
METPDMTNYNKSSKEKESSSSGKTNKDSESDLVKSTISEETYVQQQQQEKNARSVEQTVAEQILNEGNKEEMVVDEGRINDSNYDNVNGNGGSVTEYFEDKISLPFNTPRNEDDYENIFNQIKRRIESLFKQLFHDNFEERIENIRLDLHKDFELFKLTIKELFKDSKKGLMTNDNKSKNIIINDEINHKSSPSLQFNGVNKEKESAVTMEKRGKEIVVNEIDYCKLIEEEIINQLENKLVKYFEIYGNEIGQIKDEKLSEEKESTDYNNNNNNSRLIRKHEKKISEKTVENILNKITKLDYDFEYLAPAQQQLAQELIKEKQTEDVRELIQILKELTTNFNEKSTKIITENVFVKHLKDEISTLKEKCHKKEVAVEELKTLKIENEGEIRELIEEKCNYEKRFYLSEDERNRLMRMVKEFESKLREVENNNHIQYYKYVDEIKKLKESLRELDRCKDLASRRANILLVIMMIFIVVGAYFAR